MTMQGPATIAIFLLLAVSALFGPPALAQDSTPPAPHPSGQPGLRVEFSDTLGGAVRRGGQDSNSERQQVERNFNDGLRELGTTNPAARRLLESGQTVRIVCYGDPEAGGRTPSEVPYVESVETLGDFDADGNPRRAGRAVIVIDCRTVQARGGFFRVPEGGFTPVLFQTLVHELLHASHRDRRHPPDSLDLYRTWEREFIEAMERAQRANRRAQRRAARKKKCKGGSLLESVNCVQQRFDQ